MKPYKLRKSESNISPKLVECLQGGILIRFNITEVTKPNMQGGETIVYEYDEFWFDLEDKDREAVVKSYGYILTEEHSNLITKWRK